MQQEHAQRLEAMQADFNQKKQALYEHFQQLDEARSLPTANGGWCARFPPLRPLLLSSV